MLIFVWSFLLRKWFIRSIIECGWITAMWNSSLLVAPSCNIILQRNSSLPSPHFLRIHNVIQCVREYLVPRSWFFLIVGFWGLVTKSLDADTIFSSQKKFGCWRSLFVFPSFLTWWKIFFSLNLFIIHQIKSEKNAFGAENNESKEATTDSKDDETWKKGMVTSHSTKVIISHYAPNRTRVANQAILSHPTK